jgi:hypothetical protein
MLLCWHGAFLHMEDFDQLAPQHHHDMNPGHGRAAPSGSHFDSATRRDLGVHPILLWELQTVEETKIRTYEFAAEVLSTGRILCMAWAYITYRLRGVSLA